MAEFTLPQPAESALSKLQDTTLTPMEEALFHAWTQANQIKKPDAPDNMVDYRGIYKASGGVILPNGEMHRLGEEMNAQSKLERILQDRMMQHIDKVTQKHVGRVGNGPETAADSGSGASPIKQG
jgi:hypothetical protein